MNVAHSARAAQASATDAADGCRMLQWTGLSRLFTIRLDDYHLWFYPTNTSANLWIDPAKPLSRSVALFRECCQPGDIVVDVGANIGEVAIVLSKRVGEAGEVLAELIRIYQYLVGNLAPEQLHQRHHAQPRPSSAPGGVRMSDDKRDDMNLGPARGRGSRWPVDARCRTAAAADSVLEDRCRRPRTERAQGRAGALQRIACVNCELIDEHCRREGHAMGDVIAFLEQSGFQTFVISGTAAAGR
jgi:hypothetical protein